MENITPQQKRKLEKILKLSKGGNTAILEYLFEIEEKMEEDIPKITDVISRLKGSPGENYIITDKDREEIAERAREMFKDEDIARKVLSLIDIPLDKIAEDASKLVVLPVPEKVDYKKIKKEVLADIVIPKPENGKDADTEVITSNVVQSMEKNLPQFGEAFRDGLELLKGDDRLDKSAIKGIDEYDELVTFAKNGGGGTQFTAITGIKELVAGTNITIDNTNYPYPIISATGGGGGGAVDSVNGQTGVVVLDLQDITDAGATTTDAITTGGITTPYTQYDVLATPITNAEGLMQWNATDGTLDLGMSGGDIKMQLGQEMFAKVRNNTGVTIPNGTPVYYNGSIGNRPTIAPAQANSETTGRFSGLTTQDIADNTDGFITTVGYVRQIKTNYSGSGIWGTTWAEGDLLYISKTNAGVLTNIEPSAPHHSDIIGEVGVVGALGTGSILVAPTKHQTLEGLSDVNGTPLTTTGQFPVWNNTSGYFDFTYNAADMTTAIALNTAKVTNATHTGEVTGATVLTVDKTAITGKSSATAVGADYVLISDTSDSGNLKKALVSDITGGSGTVNNFNSIRVDQSGGTSDTYGVLAGLINSSNTLFTVSETVYATGTLSVYRNGKLMIQGTSEDWVETTPASGTFTFNTAPTTGDLITVTYSLYDMTTGDIVVPDGDKGDITVTSTGTVWTIDNAVVGISKLSATGTPSSSTYLRGDNTWATVSSAVNVYNQVPTGLINSSNTVFTTAGTYTATKLRVYLNGIRQTLTTDYTETTGTTFTFATAPTTGDILIVDYE